MRTSTWLYSLTAPPDHEFHGRVPAEGGFVLARLRQSEFLANVAKVFAGNGLVFVITFLAIPVIARLYTPEHYGAIGLFISVSAIAVVFATLKYEMALVLPESDQTAGNLLRASLKVVVIVSLVVLAMVFVASRCCADLQIIQSLGAYIWWLPVFVLLTASIKLLVNGWLTRKKEFGRMAMAEMSNSLVNLAIRIGLGFVVGSTVGGLVAGLIVGSLVGLLVALPASRKEITTPSTSSSMEVLKEYPEFPRYTMPADFIRTFAQNLPVLMFNFMFSPVVGGLFVMANRLIQVPVELGLHAFRGVYLQKITAMRAAKTPIRPTYLKTILIMFLLGVVPALVLFLFGTEILSFVLGDKWVEAGRFAEILAPLLLSFWVTSPAAMMLIALRRQNYWLAVQATIALLQIGVFVYAYLNEMSATWTLGAFVTVQLIVNLILKFLVYGLLGEEEGAVA